MVGEVARSETYSERVDAESLAVVLAPLPRSVALARNAVRRLLEPGFRVPPEVVEDVLLLVSELVTNVVLHARTTVRVSACIDPGRIRVSVGDDDPHHAPRRSGLGMEGTSGRGLRLVDLLASRWGIDLRDESKVVWFEATYRPADLFFPS